MSDLTEGRPPQQKPTVGRTVHYVSHGSPFREDGTQAYSSECRAATVTAVHPDDPFKVSLCVMHPTGNAFPQEVDGDFDEHKGGMWHWPERS